MSFTKHGKKSYECDVCTKRFLQPCHLANHKRTHIGVIYSGEQSHDCDVCNKSFSSSRKLHLHKRNLHSEDKPFQCDVCQKRFLQLSWLVRHKRTHIDDKPYKCNICGRRFLEPYNIERHKRTHTGVKPFECDVCKKQFSESGNLVKHKLLHTGEKRFECDICKKKFFKLDNMKKHKRTHSKDRPFECDVCKERFSRSDALNRHNRTDSSNSRECVVCKKVFCNSNRLMRHKKTHVEDKPVECNNVSKKTMLRTDQMEIFHSKAQPNECDICKKIFTEQNDLVNHRITHANVTCGLRLICDVDKEKYSQSNGKRVHSGDEPVENDASDDALTGRGSTAAYLSIFAQTNKPYTEEMLHEPKCNVEKIAYSRSCGLRKRRKKKTKEKVLECDVCHKRYSRIVYMEKHKSMCSEGQPHECDICKKKFSNSIKLHRHKVNLHVKEKSFECDVCKKRFIQPSKLVQHKRTHDDNRPHECNICGKRFLELYNFQRHKRTHSGEQPYECDVCKKKFSDSGNLLKHKLLHTGDRRFECDICKKRFFKFYNMTQHKRTHFKNRPFECDVCKKRFLRSKGLKEHKMMHFQNDHFECDICHKIFSNSERLVKHNKREHSENIPAECDVGKKRMSRIGQMKRFEILDSEDQLYECNICMKRFTGSSDLVNHEKTHADVASNEILNSDVDRKRYFQSKGESIHCGDTCKAIESDFSDNASTERAELELSECNMGKERFSQLNGKKTHSCVSNDSGFSCDIGEKSSESNGLKNRKSIRTAGHKRYDCNVCKKRYSRSDHYERHIRRHAIEKSVANDGHVSDEVLIAGPKDADKSQSGEVSKEPSVYDKEFTKSAANECHVSACKGDLSNSVFTERVDSLGEPERSECSNGKGRYFQLNGRRAHTGVSNDSSPDCDAGMASRKRKRIGRKSYHGKFCKKKYSRSDHFERHTRIHAGEESVANECNVSEKGLIAAPSSLVDANKSQSGEVGKEPSVYNKEFSKSVASECHVSDKRLVPAPSSLVEPNNSHTEDIPCGPSVHNKKFSIVESSRDKAIKSEISGNIFTEPVDTKAEPKLLECTIGRERLLQLNDKRVHSYVSNDRRFDCDVAEKMSESNGLTNRKRTRISRKSYKCNVCKKRYSRSDHFERHTKTHAGEQSVAIDCDVSSNGLIAAPNSLVEPNKSQTEEVAKESSVYKKSIENERHVSDKGLIAIPSSLVETINSQTEEIPCEPSVYNKEFSTMENSRDKPIKCDISDNALTEQVDTLREPEHSESSNGKERYSQLNGTRVHSGVANDRGFDCDVGEKSSESNGMANRKRTRIGHKSYKCKFCKKKYSRSDHFERHTRIHAGEESVANKCHVTGQNQELPFGKEASYYIICGETAIDLVGENFCDCSFCMELERTDQTTGIGFVCSLCNVVFDIHRELFEHMLTHSSELDS